MDPPEVEALFGRRLRQERERLGLSTRVLAERMQEFGLDWNHNTVLKTESAKRPVRLAEALALARILRIDSLVLLRPEESEQEIELRLRAQLATFDEKYRWAVDQAQKLRADLQKASAVAETAAAARAEALVAYEEALEERTLWQRHRDQALQQLDVLVRGEA